MVASNDQKPPPLPPEEASADLKPSVLPMPPPLPGAALIGAEGAATVEWPVPPSLQAPETPPPLGSAPGQLSETPPPLGPAPAQLSETPPPLGPAPGQLSETPPLIPNMPTSSSMPPPSSALRPRSASPGLKTAAFVLPLVLALGALAAWLVWRSKTVVAPESAIVEDTSLPSTQVPDGLLLIDAAPWGEVMRIVDAAGEEVLLPSNPYTPLTLRLPTGRYVVELSHPDLDEPGRSCDVEVAVASSGQCRSELVHMDAKQYLEEAGWWQ